MKNSLFIVLVCFASLSFGQRAQLEKAKIRVDSLFFDNQAEGLELSERMLPIAFSVKDTFYITYFLDQAGELNRMLGNYDKAVGQLTRCLRYKVGWEDLKDLSLTYNNLGKTYVNQGQYELAAKNFLIALELMEKDNNLQGKAYYLNNLGALYDLQHNYTRAIDYYQRSMAVKKKLNDLKGIASSHTNLGISYYNLGDYHKAIVNYEQSIRINREIGDPTKLARALSNLGKVYLEVGKMKEAGSCMREAYSLRKAYQDAHLLPSVLNHLSEYYLTTKQYDSSIYFNSEALKIAKDGGYKAFQDGYALRAKIFEVQHQMDSAYYALKKSRLYADSMINEANIYAVADMEGKYNYEKNLRKIQKQELLQARTDRELEEKRAVISYLLLGSTLVCAALVLLFVLFRQKRKKHALLLGQNVLIEKQKVALERVNSRVTQQLDELKVGLDDKEKLLNEVFAASSSKELPPELLSLSKREMEVLGFLALGRSDDQIAQSLFVSKSTVKTHLRRIYSKLLVTGRAEAVAIAHKYSLIGVD